MKKKVFFTILMLVFLFCSQNSIAQLLSSPAAKMYQHSYCHGQALGFDSNVPGLKGYGFDNITSSIKVAAGYKVTFYYDSNFEGRCALVVVGPYTLSSLESIRQLCQNQDWNDTISSIKIEVAGGDEGPRCYQLDMRPPKTKSPIWRGENKY